MIVRPSAALQQAQPPSAGQAAFSFTCLGGLPHCQQLSLPQHVSTTPLHSGASSFVTLRRRKSSGRQRCWQWGRPPKQVKENFLLKNTDPLLSSLLSLATWCRALRGRTRAARPGTATRRWSCEKRAGGRGSCHGVARGAAKAHTIRQRGAICDARGGLERVLVRRDTECCSGTAWQAYAAKSLQRQRWNYGAGLERQTHPELQESLKLARRRQLSEAREVLIRAAKALNLSVEVVAAKAPPNVSAIREHSVQQVAAMPHFSQCTACSRILGGPHR